MVNENTEKTFKNRTLLIPALRGRVRSPVGKMKPRTPAGAAALIAYVREDIEIGERHWQMTAFDTAAHALARI
jgi:hypothetical protein